MPCNDEASCGAIDCTFSEGHKVSNHVSGGSSQRIASTLAKLDLTRLAKRLVSEDGLPDLAFALLVIEEYKKFFFLLAESSGDDDDDKVVVDDDNITDKGCPMYLPSGMVDLVWQRHMLDTANYFEDCDRFDLPQGYCHRHELLSCNDESLVPSSDGVDCFVVAQKHYAFTVRAYEALYGSAPPQDIWPAMYDYAGRVENRKVIDGYTGVDGSGTTTAEKRYISYAIPHATISTVTMTPLLSAVKDIASYELPAEETLVRSLAWVGELVFDSLPLKQARSVQGEVICQISFDPNPTQSQKRACLVRKVVVEYARFLLLLMRQAHLDYVASRESREPERIAEITPSKLVDELWHAHILCSPAYFAFCDEYAPLGSYIHHYPHFDKPHNYHVPGFNSTLALYKEVYNTDPGVVWGVLGESGGGGDGGGGGGGCGGGGCAGCGGGGCGGGFGGGYRRAPLVNYGLINAATGCGAGIHRASCGAGNVDPTDRRPPLPIWQLPQKPWVDLSENAWRKLLCDIDIFSVCLNRHNLDPKPPLSSYVIKEPYSTTYQKQYWLRSPAPKPIPFMSEQFVSRRIYEQWQRQVELVMEERCSAACLISALPSDILKDKFWVDWKLSVQQAIDRIVAEILQAASSIGLLCRIVYSRDRKGATICLEAMSAQRKWAPPPIVSSLSLPENSPIQWNPQQISPINVYRFQQEYVVSNANPYFATVVSPTSTAPIATSASSGKLITSNSANAVQVCRLLLYSTVQLQALVKQDIPLEAEITIWSQQHLIQRLPYEDSYIVKHLFKAETVERIEFMNEDAVSARMFRYIQSRFELLVTARYAIARVIALLGEGWLKTHLQGDWVFATEMMLTGLCAELNEALFLPTIDLKLQLDRLTGGSCMLSIVKIPNGALMKRISLSTSSSRKPQSLAMLRGRAFPEMRELPNYALAFAAMLALVNAAIPSVQLILQPLAQSGQMPAPLPVSTQLPQQPGTETLSITIPTGYPQHGGELQVVSPTTGLLYRFQPPAGALPGSQILVVIGSVAR
eukprot:gene27188-32851_t